MMKIERKGEEYGSFQLEISEGLEEQIRKAANDMVSSVKKDSAEVEEVVANYQDLIGSSVSLLLSVIGIAFYQPAILNYVLATLKNCLQPLLNHLEQKEH